MCLGVIWVSWIAHKGSFGRLRIRTTCIMRFWVKMGNSIAYSMSWLLDLGFRGDFCLGGGEMLVIRNWVGLANFVFGWVLDGQIT